MSLSKGLIDLTNYKPEDLEIEIESGAIELNIQTEGGVNLVVKGKHYESANFTPLAIIDLGELTVISSISTEGLYTCAVNGIDKVYFEVSGAGKIRWKEVGE